MHAKRRDRLRSTLKKSGVPALLVTNEINVTYLTGFTGDSSYLLLTGSDAIILTDSRYTTQLEEESPDVPFVSRTSSTSMVQILQKELKSRKLKSIAVEGDSLSKNQFDLFTSKLDGVELVSTSEWVETLRQIKDRNEMAEIRRSIHLAERTFDFIRATLTPEMPERLVAANIEHQIRQFGGVGCAFKPIVGVGPRAALPHAVPGERRIEESPFVLIDWGAKAGLYMSDLTRVLVTGKISAKLCRIYEVVLRAQLAAIEAIRPGVACSVVDRAARSVIEEAGYGKRFGHGLGHGFGLEIHESPRMSSANESILKPGMVVTVEPGIYLPDWGGVRIEDDILVTTDGHEVMTHVEKNLDACVLNL